MNKSKKVRYIFAELVATLGDTIPAHELLECAALITEVCENPLNNGGAYFHEGKTPLCELPVNQVIETWGWELVESDYKCITDQGGEHQDDYMTHVTTDSKWQELLATV